MLWLESLSRQQNIEYKNEIWNKEFEWVLDTARLLIFDFGEARLYSCTKSMVAQISRNVEAIVGGQTNRDSQTLQHLN